MVLCYYCTKEIPPDQAKRCARCRLVVYCSKDCQAVSWKSSHKRNCRPHPSVVLPTGEIRNDKPKKGSDERFALDVDMCLSNWMARWRRIFQQFATSCLDLPNHPPERVLTHCMFLIIEPCDADIAKCKKYKLVGAGVAPTEEMDETFPELGGIVTKAGDLMALRFVLLLQDAEGEMLRVRRLQWSVRDMEVYRKPAKFDEDWNHKLRAMVDYFEPEELLSRGVGLQD